MLTEIPPYEALSYAWGNASETTLISLDGCRTQVTNNLHSALRHLRRKGEDRIMWIDAICIDQKNDQEKSHQVVMMKRIYETAEQVVVWLGDTVEYVGVAFEKLKLFRNFRADEVRSMTVAGVKELFGLEPWAAFKSVFSMEWWTRIWVIQEVEVARKALVVCGKDQIPVGDFDHAVSCLFKILWAGFGDSGNVEISGMTSFKNLHTWGNDLLFLAQQYIDRKSTDPRDKLYALVGIAEIMDREPDYSFVPDYSLSVLEVYQSFVEVCIQRSAKLDVLNFAMHTQLNKPSWIPDWSNERGIEVLHQYKSWHHDPFFKASGATIAEFDTIASLGKKTGQRAPDGSSLSVLCVVTGFVTDVVALQSDVVTNMEDIRSPNFVLAQQWISMYQSQSTESGPYRTQNELLAAFRLTAIADANGDAIPITRATHLHEEVSAPSFHRWMANEYSFKLGEHNFLENFYIASWGRRFVVSKKGYFGLVASEVRPGDLICILFGGQTPFVLRKVANLSNALMGGSKYLGGGGHVYQLMGECYVHGIMDGEAYEEFKRGDSDAKEQKFVLM